MNIYIESFQVAITTTRKLAYNVIVRKPLSQFKSWFEIFQCLERILWRVLGPIRKFVPVRLYIVPHGMRMQDSPGTHASGSHRGTPDTCERISCRVALSDAHSSMSCQSGNRSLSRVRQVNSVKPNGSAVTLRPCSKSSMRRPMAVTQNALDNDPM